jgi:hypothetical protein
MSVSVTRGIPWVAPPAPELPRAHPTAVRFPYIVAGAAAIALMLGLMISGLRPLISPRRAPNPTGPPNPTSLPRSSAERPPNGVPRPSEPPIVAPLMPEFYATPANVKPGQPFELTWRGGNVSRVFIDPGVGEVESAGSRTLTAASTITYVLTTTDSNGSSSMEATITVETPSAPGPPKALAGAQLYADGTAAWRRGDKSGALQLYSRAGNFGEPRAMQKLGEAFERGDGAARSPEEAARWFRRAAEAGDTASMDALGQMYANGRGVPQNDSQAATWFRRAADGHNPAGLYDLAAMYEQGRGVEKDVRQAVELYRRAAVAGDARANARYRQLGEPAGGTVK